MAASQKSRPAKPLYWLLAFLGIVVWTGAIVSLTSLPLITQLALGTMGAVAAVWGQAVMFPKERNQMGAGGRDEMVHLMAESGPLPLGTPRRAVTGRRNRD
jgi:hypothetical protein